MDQVRSKNISLRPEKFLVLSLKRNLDSSVNTRLEKDIQLKRSRILAATVKENNDDNYQNISVIRPYIEQFAMQNDKN